MLCEFFNENLEYQENLLLKYYRKHGFKVTIVASTLDSVFEYYSDKHDLQKPTREYEYNGAKIIKCQYRYVRMYNRLRKYNDITPILEAETPDLIYVHDIMLNIDEATCYVKNNPNCKMIMDYHADYSNSGRNWLSLKLLHGLIRKRFYLDPARKFIRKIFPIVPAGFTFLNEVYNIPFTEMELLPLGGDYDLARKIAANVDRKDLRTQLGIDRSDFVIFTGGKLNEVKKTDLLCEAVCNLKNDKIHVLIAGKPDSENYGQLLNDIVGQRTNFHFVGWLSSEDVYNHMAISDIAVFPASQSILWQQAICMHLPLVVGDTGGQSIEYLNMNSSIISLNKEEITSTKLETVVNMLFHNSAVRAQMCAGAAKTASEHLDWNKLIYKTLQFNIPPSR